MKLGSAFPVFSRASSLSGGLDSRSSFESLKKERLYRKTAKCRPHPTGAALRSTGVLPESLNDDSAEEDEEGRENQGQKGHHFPPEMKFTGSGQCYAAAVTCQLIVSGFFSLAQKTAT